ncbi:hypothetical protein MFLAVUS_004508 [Mucor flavus]|uniref:Tc1-like transposase DDE domain-containing protein n=1 Tax=Mucor flavus TaxID=439312 RepID=A0ABP9YW49_9FUNG
MRGWELRNFCFVSPLSLLGLKTIHVFENPISGFLQSIHSRIAHYLGAVSTVDVVNIDVGVAQMRKKIKAAGARKRKGTNTKANAETGTRTGHYLEFLKGTLDQLDRFPELKGFYLVMGNAHEDIDNLVTSRGYRCIYVPPYSPELNPIEQFWAIVKNSVKRKINMDFTNFIPPSDYYIIDDESEEQMEDVAYQYGDIEKAIDFDSPPTEIPKVDTTIEIDSLTESIKTVSIDDDSKKYEKYTPEQVRLLLKEFNDSNGSVLPGFATKAKNRGTKQKLFGQHSLFLIDYLDNHKSTTLGLTKEVLKQFPDLEDISIPSLWKHVTRASIYNEERDAERTLRLRCEVAAAEKLEQEYANPATKKRKAKDPEKKKPLKKGTTTYHIVKFLEATMDTLDRHDKKGFFIVMDNCRIYHSAFVVNAINKRGMLVKIKSNIKRNPLDKADNLTSRLPGVCGSVTVQDCQGWIRHAETFWDRCINKELGLSREALWLTSNRPKASTISLRTLSLRMKY